MLLWGKHLQTEYNIMDNDEFINTNQADTPGVPTTELDVRRQETVVVMRTADGRPATKTITQTDDGAWAKENAKLGIEYRVWRVMFDGVDKHLFFSKNIKFKLKILQSTPRRHDKYI